LSEAPDLWIAATERWAAHNARFRRTHAGRTVPEPDVEWLIYQALAGAWPIGGLVDREEIGTFAERMKSYMEKALREAKIGSNWSEPDFDYENKVTGFVDDLLRDQAFLGDFNRTLLPFIDAGLMNSLAQTLIKLTAPGIPDIYQGSERCDFSLVDPDNRALLDVQSPHVPDKPDPSRAHFTDYKQWLIATVLAARTGPALAAFDGPYTALDTSGDERQALAYMRGTPQAFAITVVPRLAFGKMQDGILRLAEDIVQDVSVAIPADYAGRTVRSVLDGRTFALDRRILLSEILRSEPVALLVST
jgi:(1->4)-alpha-D-glucan 1-alpha-D-glucosylmutase